MTLASIARRRTGVLCCAVALSVLTAVSVAGAAEPLRVDRYDDADDFLPGAQRKNKDRLRLFLPQQASEELFKVLSPRNVTVDVVAHVPADADAAVILLLGGTGVLSIVNEKLDRSFSFQPRSRDHWWANRFATFLVDAPSDRLGKEGIQDRVWRAGPEHRADLSAVVDAIALRFPGPLVIQGHSNGAISAATVASLKHARVKAYAYSGPAHAQTLTSLPTEVEHPVPVVVMQHRQDSCTVSHSRYIEPFLRAVKAPAKQVLWIEGGSDPLSGACGPFSAHSFFGVERQAIDQLAAVLRPLLR